MKRMIDRLFTSSIRTNVLIYFIFMKNKSYLREVARETKISVSAVKREVENLSKCGVLNFNSGEIELNKSCIFLEDLENILIKADAISFPLADALSKLNIKFAVIFGSFANGEFGSESDIDLLVVGDVSQKDIFDKLKPMERKIKREINSVVWRMTDLMKNKSGVLVRDILKKNKIFVIGKEDEFKKIVG